MNRAHKQHAPWTGRLNDKPQRGRQLPWSVPSPFDSGESVDELTELALEAGARLKAIQLKLGLNLKRPKDRLKWQELMTKFFVSQRRHQRWWEEPL